MEIVKYITDSLSNIGVNTLFCLPGSHALKFLDSVGRNDFRIILTCHESGAVFMADGFNRVRKDLPGVCCVTVGPGCTNSITGISTAFQDYSRVLLIAPRNAKYMWGQGALQESSGIINSIDISSIFEKITKSSLIVGVPEDAEKIPDVFNDLLNGIAGSAAISVCCDLWSHKINLPPFKFEHKNVSYPFEHKKIADIINKTNYKKSLVIIGYGALLSENSRKYVLEFLKKTNYPFITTIKAKGFISETHPLYKGVAGLYGHSSANEMLFSKKDLLISLGVSFSEFFTHSWDKRIGNVKEFIQVDLDERMMNRSYRPTFPVVCDVTKFLEKVNPLLIEKQQLSEQKNILLHGSLPKQKENTIQPQYFLMALSDKLPETAAVFCDIGNVLSFTETYLTIRENQSFFCTPNLASMGYSVPAAIGGKIANPEVPVFAICGDGGFRMTGIELVTAQQYNIPITVIVFDNSKLDMIHQNQKYMFGERYYATDFTNQINFEYFAKACNVEYVKLESLSDLDKVWKEAPIDKKPLILHVPIDIDEEPPIKFRMLATLRAIGQPWALPLKHFPMLLKMLKEK